MRVQPLDKAGGRQRVATGRTFPNSSFLQQKPGNRTRFDEVSIDGLLTSSAQTVLVSRECCHVARTVPFSYGLGLKKWVVICLAY